MKFKKCLPADKAGKLEIGNLLLIILLFFSIFLFNPISTFAQCTTTNCSACTTAECSNFPNDCVVTFNSIGATSCDTIIPTSVPQKPNFIQQLITWLFGLFIKTDYNVGNFSIDKTQDMTDYSDINDPDFDKKHSFAGSRLTDSNSQTCLKGSVIKKVILGTFSGYSDINLSNICLDSANKCFLSSDSSCNLVKVSNLANYFVQLNQQFYCDPNNNLIDTEEIVKNKVSLTPIDGNQLPCYQQIYDDFYITPKDNTDDTEENARNIIKTPLPEENLGSTLSNQKLRQRVDQNFSPEGYSGGLPGLRPENEK